MKYNIMQFNIMTYNAMLIYLKSELLLPKILYAKSHFIGMKFSLSFIDNS